MTKRWMILMCVGALVYLGSGVVQGSGVMVDQGQAQASKSSVPDVPSITAEELKGRMAKKEKVTIIDLRSANSFASSETMIKGAVKIKLRRLKFRAGFAPLKDAPKDSLVVTYCACPNDETARRAVKVLNEVGFKQARVLKGGWDAWKAANGPVKPSGKPGN